MLEEDVFLLFGFFMLSGRVIKYKENLSGRKWPPVGELTGLQLAWKFSDFLSTEEKMSSITGFGDDGAKILKRWSMIASDVLLDPKLEEEMFPILLVDWEWTNNPLEPDDKYTSAIASDVLLDSKFEEEMFPIQRMQDSTGLPIFQYIGFKLFLSVRFEEYVYFFVE